MELFQHNTAGQARCLARLAKLHSLENAADTFGACHFVDASLITDYDIMKGKYCAISVEDLEKLEKAMATISVFLNEETIRAALDLADETAQARDFKLIWEKVGGDKNET